MATTVAPGRAPPLESVTIPEIEEVVTCASTAHDNENRVNTNSKIFLIHIRLGYEFEAVKISVLLNYAFTLLLNLPSKSLQKVNTI